MITFAAAALFTLAWQTPATPITCGVMPGGGTTAKSPAVEYNGAKFTFCCGGCDSSFSKSPGKYIAAAAGTKNVIGEFLFDPVSGARLDLAKTKIKSDYKGVRYPFASAANLKVFTANPAKYATWPKNVSLICPVAGDRVDAYSFSAGYVDFKDTRYFVCCKGCLAPLQKDPAGIIAQKKGKVIAAVAMPWKNGSAMEHDK